jgi:cysteine-rich repeat protein
VGIVRTVALWCLVGCIEPTLTICADGIACPAALTCSPVGGCVEPSLVAVCDGRVDGDPCMPDEMRQWHCRGGVCADTRCGDAIVDPGEQCDDGNDSDTDGCSRNCAAATCGDGTLQDGELCDDGNANPGDGCDACTTTTWTASALVGGSAGLGDRTALDSPSDVAVDSAGNVFIADTAAFRVRRRDAATGLMTTFAGTGTSGSLGDGGAATSAQLTRPYGLTVDGFGNVYIADSSAHRVRRVDASTGVITTIAGTGVSGSSGDGGPAAAARLNAPSGVAVDGLGNLFIADRNNYRVRRVDGITGVITTYAGTGNGPFSGDDGPATSAVLQPLRVAIDPAGDLYVTDANSDRVRKIDAASQIITTYAGGGASAAEGIAATAAQLPNPSGITFDPAGNLYVTTNPVYKVRRVDKTSQTITTVAGTGSQGFAGDGGPATSAQLSVPDGVAHDGTTLYIADTQNHRLRSVVNATIATAVGTGSRGFTGDGLLASCTKLGYVNNLSLDSLGRLYAVDTFDGRLIRIDSRGVLTMLATNLSFPHAVAIDSAGNAYVANAGSNSVVRVDAITGAISRIAGIGSFASSGDDGPAIDAALNFPMGLVIDAAGNLFVSENFGARVRRIDAVTKIITTYVGGGTGGDGGLAVDAELYDPQGLAIDAAGNLYIGEGTGRVRRVDVMTGVISTVAGNGIDGDPTDGRLATETTLSLPYGVGFDNLGRLLIVEAGTGTIRRVDAQGIMSTVAGSAAPAGSGDGMLATATTLSFPNGVVSDLAGNLFIADTFGAYVRRVDATTNIITTFAGDVDPEGVGPQMDAWLADPRAIAVIPGRTLFAGGTSGRIEASDAGGFIRAVAGRYNFEGQAGSNRARFGSPTFGTIGGIAYDALTHRLFVTETSAHRIHIIDVVDPADEKTWTITTLANTAGTAGATDGDAATARFREPTGLHYDPATHTLLVADTGNHAVRAIALGSGLAQATVTTVVGKLAQRGFSGDGGDATAAKLFAPQAIARCDNGDLFVADTGNRRVRRVSQSTITTVLGDGTASSAGDGAPSTSFPVDAPGGVACDAFGNLFVTSTWTVRMLVADDTHVIDGSGRVATIYGAAPRTTFPQTATRCLSGIASVAGNRLQIVDACAGLWVELTRAPTP